MSLPYENAQSGTRALQDIEKILRTYDCDRFGSMTDWARGVLIVQFEWRERRVHLEASWRGYAERWLRDNPWNSRRHSTQKEWEMQARRKGELAAPSILRDWIKAQITAVEVGLMPFEHAFMPHMLMDDGKRVIEHVIENRLLPAPETPQ